MDSQYDKRDMGKNPQSDQMDSIHRMGRFRIFRGHYEDGAAMARHVCHQLHTAYGA